MSTQIHHYDWPIPPARLDDYLTNGWRPSGQAVYSSDYLRTDDDQLHGVLQVRLPLAGFAFKKRHRKLLRRNNARFRVHIGPAGAPDDELRALNQRYMVLHPEKTRDDLEIHVQNALGLRVLDTYVVRVYDGDRLAAFSYCDLGVTRMYSKAGIYDPDYARDSLGIYTMLLEIDFARQRGITHYHPGYVAPTYPLFHYKLQFGPMEVRRLDGSWVDYEEERANTLNPYAYSLAALEKLVAAADPALELAVMEYVSFTARYHYPDDAQVQLLDGALLVANRNVAYVPDYVVVYDPVKRRYRLLEVNVTVLHDHNRQPVGHTGLRRYPYVLNEERDLVSSPEVEPILAQIARMGNTP